MSALELVAKGLVIGFAWKGRQLVWINRASGLALIGLGLVELVR